MKQLTDIAIDPQKLRKARLSAYPATSLTRVAAYLGLSKQSLSAYESGISRPNADTLAQICLLYRVEVTDLIDADAFDIKLLRDASINA